MGDTPPSTVELICPGCGAYFRLKPKKGKLPKGPIPCPKCKTSIPVELSTSESGDGSDSPRPESAPPSKPKSPPMSGIITRQKKIKKPTSQAAPESSEPSDPEEVAASASAPDSADGAPTVDKHRAALEALLDDDKGPNSTFLGFGFPKKGAQGSEKTAAIDAAILDQVRATSTKAAAEDAEAAHEEDAAPQAPEPTREAKGSTTDTSHFMKSEANEGAAKEDEPRPREDFGEEPISNRLTPVHLDKLDPTAHEAPKSPSPIAESWSEDGAPGPFDLRDILEAEKEQLGDQVSNEVTRNPALDIDNPIGDIARDVDAKPIPTDLPLSPAGHEPTSTEESRLTVAEEISSPKRASVLGRLKKNLAKEEEPAVDESLAQKLERLGQGVLDESDIIDEEQDEPSASDIPSTLRDTKENHSVTEKLLEASEPERPKAPPLSTQDIFDESSAILDDSSMGTPHEASEANEAPTRDDEEEETPGKRPPLAALLKRKLGKAGFDELKEKVEGHSEVSEVDGDLSSPGFPKSDQPDEDPLADILSGADEDDLARVLDEASGIHPWPRAPKQPLTPSLSNEAISSADDDEEEFEELDESDRVEPSTPPETPPEIPRAKTKMGGFAAIKLPPKPGFGIDNEEDDEELEEASAPHEIKSPRLSLSQKRERAQSLLRALDAPSEADEKEQQQEDTAKASASESAEKPSVISWGGAELHTGDNSGFNRKRRRQESHSGLFPITGGLGQESSVGMAGEKRGSGYIRLPTSEILDVLGSGQYRLMVEDIVYEPVDEVGLTELVKRGVLIGAELIAEQGGEWTPIVEHPVFRRLRKKMAYEAHALLSKYKRSGQTGEMPAFTDPPPKSATEEVTGQTEALDGQSELVLEERDATSAQEQEPGTSEETPALSPPPLRLSAPPSNAEEELEEEQGEDSEDLFEDASAPEEISSESEEDDEEDLFDWDAPLEENSLESGFPSLARDDGEDAPSVSFEIPVYKDPEPEGALFPESEVEDEDEEEGFGDMLRDAPTSEALLDKQQAPPEDAPKPEPRSAPRETETFDTPEDPLAPSSGGSSAGKIIVGLLLLGVLGAAGALALKPEWRAMVLGNSSSPDANNTTVTPPDTNNATSPTKKPGDKTMAAITAASGKLTEAASGDYTSREALLGMAKSAKGEDALALYDVAWSIKAPLDATIAYAKALEAAEQWGTLRRVAGSVSAENKELAAMRSAAIERDPAMRGLTPERIGAESHGEAMKALQVGRTTAFALTDEAGKERWVFKPEQSGYARDGWIKDVFAWRLCQLITCNILVPETIPARIDEETFNTLVSRAQGSGAAQPSQLYGRLEWKSEKNADGKKVRYVEGVLKRWIDPEPAFDMNYTRTWRDWVDAGLDEARLDQPLEESLEGVKGENEALYNALIAQKGKLSTREFGRQISSMIVLDYLLNNRNRFSDRPVYNGVDNQIVNGQLVSYDHATSMESRLSSRVRGRLSWVTRLSQAQVESIGRLTREDADAILFPEGTSISSSEQRAFWSRHEKLLSEVNERSERYGKDKALAFE